MRKRTLITWVVCVLTWICVTQAAVASSPAEDSKRAAFERCAVIRTMPSFDGSEDALTACLGSVDFDATHAVGQLESDGWALFSLADALGRSPSVTSDKLPAHHVCPATREALAVLARAEYPELVSITDVARCPVDREVFSSWEETSGVRLAFVPAGSGVRVAYAGEALLGRSFAIARDLGGPDGKGVDVWVTTVPKGESSWVRLSHLRWEVPLVEFVPADATLLDLRRVVTRCLDVQVESRDGTPLVRLIDGTKVDNGRHRIAVLFGDGQAIVAPRQMQVVGEFDGGATRTRVWLTVTLDAEARFRNKRCTDVRADLSEPNQYALVDVRAAAKCTDVGGNAEVVRAAAKERLERRALAEVSRDGEERLGSATSRNANQVVDLRGVAGLGGALQAVEQQMQGEGGIGAARGQRDNSAAAEQAIGELWRHGIREAWAFELECGTQAYQPWTLVGRRLDLMEATTSARGTVTGTVTEPFNDDTEVVVNPLDLGPATSRLVARMVGAESISLDAAQPAVRLHEHLEVNVSVDGSANWPTDRVVVDAYEIDTRAAHDICRRLPRSPRDHTSLFERATKGTHQASVGIADRANKQEPAATDSDAGVANTASRLRVWPHRADTVVVRARLFKNSRAVAGSRHDSSALLLRARMKKAAKVLSTNGVVDTAYTCVDVEPERFRVWLEAQSGWAWVAGRKTRDATGPANSTPTRARLGIEVPLRFQSPARLVLGISFGYGNTLRRLPRDPGWNDVVTADGPDDPLRWTRHALLVGGRVGVSAEGCKRAARACGGGRRRLLWQVEAGGDLDGGIIDARSVDRRRVAFRENRRDNVFADADFDVVVAALVGVRVTKMVWGAILVSAHALAVDDIAARKSGRAVTITDDAGWSVLLGARWGISR